MNHTTQTAALEWRDGQPYSKVFEDVYFSSDNGLLETEHVFIQGNNIPNRWQTFSSSHFTILETGFGTGLNFLCACTQWLKHAPESAVLQFISVEKYPLAPADMSIALQHWPTLTPVTEALLLQYETLLNEGSITLFNQRVKLTMLLGDASECLSNLDIKADAWFLDGFSPSKNPDMWQPVLFEYMARLSHASTTFATFTSAGFVRRGLAAAGFNVNKQPGFGRKREMISGNFAGTPHDR